MALFADDEDDPLSSENYDPFAKSIPTKKNEASTSLFNDDDDADDDLFKTRKPTKKENDLFADDDEEGEGEGVRAVAATSDAGGGEDGCRGSIHTSPPPPPPPPRTPTNQLRRRARGLSKELSVGAFSREGRERLADFLEARPALAGAKLLWRVEGSTQAGGVARLVKSLKAGGHAVNAPPREDEVIGSWPLSELLDLSGGRTCDD